MQNNFQHERATGTIFQVFVLAKYWSCEGLLHKSPSVLCRIYMSLPVPTAGLRLSCNGKLDVGLS